MGYVARPAPKMGLGEQENPLAHLVRLMAEYYAPGDYPASMSGGNVTSVPMSQTTMPTSDRLPPNDPVRIDLRPPGQPPAPGWTTQTVQGVERPPGMDPSQFMPMPQQGQQGQQIPPMPVRGSMPPGGGAPVPPMPVRGERMAVQGGNIPSSASPGREEILKALMGAEQRPPLQTGPQFGTLDWWNQMGK